MENNLHKSNWIVDNSFENIDNFDIYITSLKYTISTLMTLNDDKIIINTIAEKVFYIILLLKKFNLEFVQVD